MAPNLYRLKYLCDAEVNCDNIRVKASFQPLAQQVSTANTESYWDWPSESAATESIEDVGVEPEPVTPSLNLFSIAFIESKLTEQTALKSKVREDTKTNPSFDDYWAEAGIDQTEESVATSAAPAHYGASQSAIDSQSYWSTSHATSESDDYWTMNTPNVKPSKSHVLEKSDAYWQWKHSATASDAYWNSESNTRVHDADAYWQCNHAKTDSDAYWSSESTSLSSHDRYWQMSHAPTNGDDYWNWQQPTATH